MTTKRTITNPVIVALFICVCAAVSIGAYSAPQKRRAVVTPAKPDPRYFNLGAPKVVDLWLDPQAGDDTRDGLVRAAAVKSLRRAWALTMEPRTDGAGYRVNILPGLVGCGDWCGNTFQGRRGTYAAPTIWQKAPGSSGEVIIEGGLNVYDVSYLYLLNITLAAGGQYGITVNDVLHLERADTVVVRGCVLIGNDPGIQEVIKANQSRNLHIEGNDISRATQTAIDLMACQYASVINNKLHHTGTWAAYAKGGSAYVRFEGNDVYNTKFGISAGEGSGFQYMVKPWVQYEAYDVKVVNNYVRDVEGAGLAVFGAYNALLASNTLRNVACGATGYGVFTVGYGARICSGDALTCRKQAEVGGWGSVEPGWDKAVSIPNKNVYFYNNWVSNTNCTTRYGHLVVYGKTKAALTGLPVQVAADDNLRIKGNVIWNPGQPLLGVEHESWGCQPSNTTCNPAQLRKENTINQLDPLRGLKLPKRWAVPRFAWTLPDVPAGDLNNTVKAGSWPKDL